MLTTQTIVRLLDRKFIVPAFLYLLLVSIVLLADVYSIVYFAGDYGVYLVLGIAAGVSLFGVLLTTAVLARRLRLLRRAVYLSQNPMRHYRAIASVILAGLLFLPPGAVSSALAVLCILPIIRAVPGSILTLLCRRELKPVYDYLKMEDAHPAAAPPEGAARGRSESPTGPTEPRQAADRPGANETRQSSQSPEPRQSPDTPESSGETETRTQE